MKNYAVIFTLFLAGCGAAPLSVDSMKASPSVYNQIDKDFYLKNKVAVEPIKSELPPKILNPEYYNDLYRDATLSLSSSLNKAGMLSSGSKVQYTLRTTLIDVESPRCFLGTCETGSTIKYELRHGDNVVYQDVLVVPQNYDYSLFGANMTYVVRATLGAALGNNFAHLIHVLADKKKEDLK